MPKITKDMTIAEIVEKYPETAEVFFSYGLHCIGCPAAASETLENGVLGHGLEEDKLKDLLEDLNKAVED